MSHKTSPSYRDMLLVDINSIYHFRPDVLPFYANRQICSFIVIYYEMIYAQFFVSIVVRRIKEENS